MQRIVRIAVMWLVALAVPAQGHAAAVMPDCEHAHHLATSGESHARVTESPLAKTRQQASAPERGLVPGDQMPESAESKKGLDDHDSLADPTDGDCGPCSSCCTSTGFPAMAASYEPVGLANSFERHSPHKVGAFLTNGLERPPRFILA